jgi:hypothetical protein
MTFLPVTILSDPRVAIGKQVLWRDKKMVCIRDLGENIDSILFDAVSLNPLDYQRFKETGPKYDA